MKIGVVGLYSNKNIGDYLLVESAKYLLKKHSPDVLLKDVDVDPRNEDLFQGRRRVNRKLFNIMNRFKKPIFSIIKNRTFQYYYEYFMWWVKVNWFYRKTIRNLDGLVIAGGGFIKFRTQGLNYLDEQIIKIAKKRNIPVMFSAVGIEGYDDNDIRCRKLKKAINSGIVKVITTRDDLETLRNKYIINDNIVTEQVGDPVFWLQDVYPTRRNANATKIGINLINPNNYSAYGGNINRRDVVNFYKNLLTELDKRDAEFYLFSNGMEVDQRFGRKLLASLKMPKSRLVRRPEDSPEFLEIVSEFKIILAARMHAGIVAYALDIPKVGLIWSGKIEFLANIIGERDTYFDEDELDYKKIADLLCAESPQEVDIATRDVLKSKTLHYIGSFLDGIERDISAS